ncbi:MAG: FkbM family methyltransferase [Saprospiraceae bacterium]|nr:FkbM family methyltransferase [Saprospiraceae bacterium]
MQELAEKLKDIERLARGSIFARLLANPKRYIESVGFWRFVYPFTNRGKQARATTFFGAEMELVLPAATEIYLFGAKTHDSEIRLARFLMKNLQPGDSFCDVGAHFGYFSLLASQLVGKNGQVLAFEASKSTFGILEKNLRPYSNTTPLHRAASNENTSLVFNEFPPLYSEYNTLVPQTNAAWMKNNPAQPIAVQGQRLADFFLSENIRPSIIKIDVEGAEPQVLEGLEPFFESASPVIVMEYLLSSGQNEAHQTAAKQLFSHGYSAFRIENNGDLNPCNDIQAAMSLADLDSDNIVFKR